MLMKKVCQVVCLIGIGVAVGRLPDFLPLKVEAGRGQPGGGDTCTSMNGDVNADGRFDLTDAVTILGHLFQGQPENLAIFCKEGTSSLRVTGQGDCFDANIEFNVIDCSS